MALKRGIVELEDYNYSWKDDYLKEEKLLKELLGNRIIEIHHIGSTSIEGLKAKPIIDILIVIDSLNNISEIEDNKEYLIDIFSQKVQKKLELITYILLNQRVIPTIIKYILKST